MITANTIIERAMRLIQVLTPDANPTAQELLDGLYALNSMLDAWSIDRLLVYQVVNTARAWPASVGSRTIGVGGDYNVTRPSKVDPRGNFFRDADGIDTGVTVIERQIFDDFLDKTSGGTPEWLAVDTGFPLMTLYAYPVPSAALTLHLNTWVRLQEFASGVDQLSLPAGYQTAIEYGLALEIAPEFGSAAMTAAERIAKLAALKKSSIKGINMPSMVARIDYPGSGRNADIHSDQ